MVSFGVANKRWALGLGVLTLPLMAAWSAGAAPNPSKRGPAPSTPNAQRPTPPKVDFNREVRPILAEHCFSCHGFDADKRQAGLRLDMAEGLTRKGSSGKPIVMPGKPDAGELIRRVVAHDDLVMPPASTGKRLSRTEIDVLRRWIAQGARFEAHWAYVPPKPPPLPPVKNRAWVRNPIDAFVLARLEREGLKPSPEADPAVLLRRVSLDLTGLPPTPKQVRDFVQDLSGDAYEKAVDRLLASPQFGERWARPWLDLARYADSHGFQRDDLRDIWPYRDWVIRALNADMPYDQFTIEQIAGDLLPNATEAQKVATGFHRCTTTNVEAGSEPEETRVNQVIDRVNTTAAVWLGTTLECAQCHDHKYDPFTRKDYYRLFAFFNNTALEAERADPKVPGSIRFLGPTMTVADPEKDALRERLRSQVKHLDDQLDARRKELQPGLAAWEEALPAMDPKRPADISRFLKIEPGKRNAAQKRRLLEYRLTQDPAAATLLAERARLIPEGGELQSTTTLVMQELPQPRPTAIFLRGDYRQRGEAVQPGTPAAFPSGPTATPNRLTLARWLVSPQNPLAARVAVNRWWAELFGRGIVATLEDFGVKGEPPTHPELLDYLASVFSSTGAVNTAQRGRGVEEPRREKPPVINAASDAKRSGSSFILHPSSFDPNAQRPTPNASPQGLGWSTKRLLKLIVTSATYRQSSRVTPELLARDPENRLLARGARHRMDAEMIRDNILSVAGLLSLKQGGPPVRPPQPDGLWRKVGGAPVQYEVSSGEDRHRRGIYVVWKRATPYPSFVNFDATSRLTCTVKRSRSNTPLQALTLLNDPVYVEAAMALAHRMLEGSNEIGQRERLASAIRRVLSRDPRGTELAVLERLLDSQRAAYRSDPKAARDLVAPYPKPKDVPDVEFAAWYAVATALLNLDETITKG